MNKNLVADFCIEIDFKKDSEAPSRVFRAMSDLIEAFHAFDKDLVQSIDPKIEPVLLLEDIETGSIKAWLKYLLLEVVDDEALRKLDWKPAIGKYLVKAKYLVVNFLEYKTEITDRSQVEALEKEFFDLAKETDIKYLPAYTPVPRLKILQNIERLTKATSELSQGDRVIYRTRESSSTLNLTFKYVPESIEEILTKEVYDQELKMILKVKKPDYLGESKWEFRHENKTIPAKILDTHWLIRFQNREIDIRPGDSIRARVQLITKYGHDLNVISVHHNILKVDDMA